MSLTIDHIRKMQEARRAKASVQCEKRIEQEISGPIDPKVAQLHPQAAKRLESMPESCRPAYRRAMSGKSRNAAIRAMCVECMGYNRADVPRCTSPACPLYPYRPGASR